MKIILLLIFTFLACSNEKEKIDSLFDKKDVNNIINYLNNEWEKKKKGNDGHYFNYILNKALKEDFSRVYSMIEEKVLKEEIWLYEIADLYKKNGKEFLTLPQLVELIQNGKNLSCFLTTYSPVKLKTFIENEIISHLNLIYEGKIDIKNIISVQKKFSIYNDFIIDKNQDFVQLSRIVSEIVLLNNEVDRDFYIPSKPEYIKPKYNGVFYLSGEYIGPFASGGIIVKSSGQYYLIKGAMEPRNFFAKYLNGYVEDTDREILLDLGRKGTPCKVVYLSDRETYLDDQKEYQSKVTQAKDEYQRKLKVYNDAIKQYSDHIQSQKTIIKKRSVLLNQAIEITNSLQKTVYN